MAVMAEVRKQFGDGDNVTELLLPGDDVILTADVIRPVSGVGVLVHFDGYPQDCWIRENRVSEVQYRGSTGSYTALVRGTVLATDWHQITVELFSKTDQYQIEVRPGLVTALILAQPPAEPADGHWKLVGGPEPAAFHRDDRGAPAKDDRRWPRRWFDVAGQNWIGWPDVYRQLPDNELTQA